MNYNERTVISGEEVILSKDETEGVERFHNSRVAFAIVDGKLAVNSFDKREHRIYLEEDFGIKERDFERLVRGYIKPERIVVYITSGFLPVSKIELREDLMVMLKRLALESFGSGRYEIWNGLAVGRPGEEWRPLEILGEVEISD